jgi:hypothetical protein
MGWRTVAGVLDAGTAVCAAVNAAYFLDRLSSGVERTAPRRLAVLTLAVVSVASLLEAAVLLAVTSRDYAGLFDSAPWAGVRFLVFLGGAAITALIARRWILR